MLHLWAPRTRELLLLLLLLRTLLRRVLLSGSVLLSLDTRVA
jgi:hypothetical protein